MMTMMIRAERSCTYFCAPAQLLIVDQPRVIGEKGICKNVRQIMHYYECVCPKGFERIFILMINVCVQVQFIV